MYYAHWIPRGDKNYIDRLETVRTGAASKALPSIQEDAALSVGRDELNEDSWHHFGTITEKGQIDDLEVTENLGEPSGIRTLDPLIKRRGPVMSRPSPLSARLRVTARPIYAFAS